MKELISIFLFFSTRTYGETHLVRPFPSNFPTFCSTSSYPVRISILASLDIHIWFLKGNFLDSYAVEGYLLLLCFGDSP